MDYRQLLCLEFKLIGLLSFVSGQQSVAKQTDLEKRKNSFLTTDTNKKNYLWLLPLTP